VAPIVDTTTSEEQKPKALPCATASVVPRPPFIKIKWCYVACGIDTALAPCFVFVPAININNR
jgi:hypothetical protein